MADLTVLEEKLGEVLGLAQAAQKATEKVEGLPESEDFADRLQKMGAEAEETEQRCSAIADGRERRLAGPYMDRFLSTDAGV